MNLDLKSKLIVSVVLLSVIQFTCGLTVGLRIATVKERQKAIDANVGRWSIDAESGKRNFVYDKTNMDFTK